MEFKIPKALSYLAFLDGDHFVPGISDLVHGNKKEGNLQESTVATASVFSQTGWRTKNENRCSLDDIRWLADNAVAPRLFYDSD